MNTKYRKPLPNSDLDYFDTREAIEAIKPGAYAGLPYTSRVLAEQLVRRCDPDQLEGALKQIIERKRDLDFPWYPARVVCHDILGQTALVDLAGLRDAIADKGGNPAEVNPVVPTQLIVDHSLAVEHAGFDPEAFEKNRAIEDRRNEDRFHFIEWTKTAFENIDVIPAGNGIMHQINLEKMSPVKGRLQIKQGKQAIRIIDDTYNANPTSLSAAINVLSSYSGQRYLVLGDMGELGESSIEMHADAGVNAGAEAKMAAVVAGDVKAIRVVEDALVAVG